MRDQRVVQIITHPMGLHPVALFRQLTPNLTVVLHEVADVDGSELDALRAGGVDVVEGPVTRVVTGDDGHVAAVELSDGRRFEADAVVVGPRFAVRIEPFVSIGLTAADHPIGSRRLRRDRHDR